MGYIRLRALMAKPKATAGGGNSHRKGSESREPDSIYNGR